MGMTQYLVLGVTGAWSPRVGTEMILKASEIHQMQKEAFWNFAYLTKHRNFWK